MNTPQKLTPITQLSDTKNSFHQLSFRILSAWMQLNEKYRIAEKIYHYTNNLLELIHLVCGIDIKKFFKRRNTGTSQGSMFDDRPPPKLPETSEEAIQFLLNESPDKPYR